MYMGVRDWLESQSQGGEDEGTQMGSSEHFSHTPLSTYAFEKCANRRFTLWSSCDSSLMSRILE